VTGTSPEFALDVAKLVIRFLLISLLAFGVAAAPDDASVRLRITQHQSSCCYREGSVSYVEVRAADGAIVVSKEFHLEGLIQAAVDQPLAPGSYTIRSWQRPCNGDCSRLDGIVDACEASFTAMERTDLFVTAAFAPRTGCTLTQTVDVPVALVPDAVALRDYQSCGEDHTSARAFYFGPYAARECFSAANRSGEEREIVSTEVSATEPDTVDRVIYITHQDRSIEVFRQLHLGGLTSSWQRYTCAGLQADDQRLFAPAQCGEPQAL
jgi:hypothetical protein